MRYIRPQITGIFDAASLIQSDKQAPQLEIDLVSFTNGPAYQSEE